MSQPTVILIYNPQGELASVTSQWMDWQFRHGSPRRNSSTRFIRTNFASNRPDYPWEEKDLSRPSEEILSEQVMTETLALLHVRQKIWLSGLIVFLC